jgi:uncharacterized protein
MPYLGFEHLPEAGGLPIFRRKISGDESRGPALYYAPGYVTRASGEGRTALEREITRSAIDSGYTAYGAAALLLRHAREAQARWREMLSAPFQPLCLTVYPTSRCNLRCTYCYAAADGGETSQELSIEAVRDAARIVAGNCRMLGRPFTLVVHGGGEPTFAPSALEATLQAVTETAALYRLPLFKYIATNGVMPLSRARWLARTFDLVGLSCDGPGEIQDRQRPLASGKSSTPYVERTADILHEAGKHFNVRVTLTPETIDRQEEIVAYICARLRPQEIHIEPVYRGGRANAGLGTNDAELAQRFVEHFLHAQNTALESGARLVYTGARPAEIHGPYCQVLRGVLNLVPGGGGGNASAGTASACFKLSDAAQVRRLGASVGNIGEEGFAIDYEHVLAMRRSLGSTPPACLGCFNRFHCARACPDDCPLEQGGAHDPFNTFRCMVQMRLAEAEIESAADELPADMETAVGIRIKRAV